MLITLIRLGIVLLSLSIFPMQLLRSYQRFAGGNTDAVVSPKLFPLLICQSALWYVYAVLSGESFIIFTSVNNVLCQIGIFVLMRLDSPSFVIRQYTEVSHDDTLVKSSYDLTVNAPVNAPVNAVQYVNPSFYPPPHTPLHPYTPRNTHAYRQHQQRYQ